MFMIRSFFNKRIKENILMLWELKNLNLTLGLLSLKPESGLFTFDRVNLALTWDKGRDSCTFNQLLTHFTNLKFSKTKILKKKCGKY